MTVSPGDLPERAPDVVGEAQLRIRSTPDEVLEFILDVERYKSVDSKIGTIHWVRRSANGRAVTFRFTPRLGPLPPVVRSTQRVARVGDDAVSISPVPSPIDRLARFHGSMQVTQTDDGVLVRRRLEFWLVRPLRGVLGPVLQRFLDRDVPAELAAVRSVLERDA